MQALPNWNMTRHGIYSVEASFLKQVLYSDMIRSLVLCYDPGNVVEDHLKLLVGVHFYFIQEELPLFQLLTLHCMNVSW